MTATEDQVLYQLVYRSRSALSGSDASIEAEVTSILNESPRNNARNSLTGALMFTASVFIQVLEGRCDDIERTFEHICCDLCHMGVELLSFSSVLERTFGDWNMHRIHASTKVETLFRELDDLTDPADAVSKAIALMVDFGRNKVVASLATLTVQPVSPDPTGVSPSA